MKTFITILALMICISLKAQTKKSRIITLTVTYLHREDNKVEVQAKRSYQLWKANCKSFPDSIKLGQKFIAIPAVKRDTCSCIFRRVK